MKSNRASTSAMPSPTCTHATTYTVPRSSPLLSSSFTPFYPRSQQQMYHSQLDPSGNHDAGCYAFPQELNGNDVHSYEWPGSKFYSQQCYTSSGSEPYKVPWVSNNGNVWGGGAWQWGDSVPEEYVYADDEAEDSAYLHSDSLSYYAESPALEQDFYTCSTSNTASTPTLHPDPGAATSNVPHHSAILERASCFSKVKEHLTPSLMNSFIQDQAAPFCTSGKQGPAKSMSNEVANASSSGKLDARPFSIQVSSQMGSSVGITSQVVEPKMMKQATTDMTENRRTLTNSSKPFTKSCCNSSDEHGPIELKHSIQATSNTTNTLELLEGINLDAPTMSISAEVARKEVESRNSLPLQSSSSQLLSTNGQCPGMTIPKHINAQAHNSSLIETAPLEQSNMGSLLSKASVVVEMEGKPCVKAIDHEAMRKDKMGSSNNLPGNAWLYLNGPQLLVKCIHNLSKVLLASQSGTSLNILDPTDCFAIENTIFILSHRLSQSSINEAQNQNCHQLQVAEQESKISDDTLKFNEEAGSETFQQKSSSLLEGMKHKMKVSPSRVLENEALTASSCVEGDERADQSSFVKKQSEKPWEDLLMLQCSVMKLQEEVTYERAESNATVTTYKKLWSEAQEALKVSRSEIKELRSELANLKQDFTNLKHSGPGGLGGMPADLELTKCDMNTSCINQGGLHENLSDVTTGSTQCFTERDLHCAPNDDRCSAFCGSSKEPFSACSEVMTEYFDPVNISNCRENWTPYAKGEKVISRHNNQSGNMLEISTSEPSSKHVARAPTNLEDEVTRRLSLLLARPGLSSNRNVELEASSNLSSDGDAMPPDKMENYSIWFETSYIGNAKKGIGGAEADLSCQRKPAHEISYGRHSLAERESNTRNTRNVDAEDVNVQEDEVEIICLKPGVAESSFTCLKGEPEWEHVVVNALDDQKTTRQGNNLTNRKVHR